MIPKTLIPLIALSGLLFGYLLTRIAPEELREGRKYFFLMKHILFILLFITINYYFAREKMFLPLLIFAFIMGGLFVAGLKLSKQIIEIGNYVIFTASYFIILQTGFQLLVASLVFLYGLPAGTLIKDEE